MEINGFSRELNEKQHRCLDRLETSGGDKLVVVGWSDYEQGPYVQNVETKKIVVVRRTGRALPPKI